MLSDVVANGTSYALCRIMDAQTILIVDDEPRFRFSLALILAHHGYYVLEGSDGVEALRVLSEHSQSLPHIDLVITDIRMPGMDGLELIKCIRQSDAMVKVLVMTGFGDRDTVSRLQEMGVSGVIHKPFDDTQLLAMIRSTLSNIHRGPSC